MVTEDEALRLDEAWSISRGYHDRWLQERLVYEAEAARQAEQLGRQPSDTEINRSLLSRHASEALAEMQLGIYTSWLYKLAELEKRDEKFDRAIDLSLRVCFLDANGPVNGPDFEGRVFDSKTALRRPLAAACIVAESAIRLGLNQQSIEQRYMRVAGSVREEFKTPRTVKGVWNDNVQGAMRAAWKDAEEWLFGKPD
ncbi:MAG: hypothetical protein IT442_17335 [Phycisphaeraceae bacterium]|nr:hypothetical protein [Phycisphaeraceae bacterium]